MNTALITPVVKMFGDTSVSFPKFSVQDISEMIEKVKAEYKSKAEKMANKAGLKGKDFYQVLAEADDFEPTHVYLWSLAQAPKLATEVVRQSLKKANKSDDEVKEVIDNMSMDDVVEVAALVLGRTLPRAKAEHDHEEPVEKKEEYSGYQKVAHPYENDLDQGSATDWEQSVALLLHFYHVDPSTWPLDVFYSRLFKVGEIIAMEKGKPIDPRKQVEREMARMAKKMSRQRD